MWWTRICMGNVGHDLRYYWKNQIVNEHNLTNHNDEFFTLLDCFTFTVFQKSHLFDSEIYLFITGGKQININYFLNVNKQRNNWEQSRVPVSRCVIQDSRTNKTNSKHNLTYQINRGVFLNRLRYFFTGLIQQFALDW